MKLDSSCADCFCGLSVDNRIKIVNLLQEKGRMSVLEVAQHFSLKQPTITHHLQYLKKVGLLASQKKGRHVFYFVDPKCKRKGCYVFA